MRLLNFGVIIAFLVASMHMVVDHGGGPRDFVFIPHVSILPFHADDHDHEPSGSHARRHHDADTPTHVEWYTPAVGSDVPSQPIIAVLIESDAGLTAPLSLPPLAFMLTPPTIPPHVSHFTPAVVPFSLESYPASLTDTTPRH
jgi:hypothetical protein